MQETSNRIVSVIVVTAGIKNYLSLCLDSLQQQTTPALETIVIDNSSDPLFGQKIINSYPEVKLYSSPKNLFYCQALNKGIQMSNGDFILCLNDDVILDKKFIEEALKGFSNDAKIGMVSGKILRQDRKTIDSTGLFLSFFRTAKERDYGCYDSGKFDKEGYIFGVNGAVAFYRREMLEDVKENSDYFDSDFRIFYEDLDISWRAQRLVWRGYYIPEAVAYHVRGGTVRGKIGIDNSFARRFLSDCLQVDLIKNRYLTIIKNESFFDFLMHLLGIIFYDFIVWSYILFFRPHILKIFFLNLRYLEKAFRKRGKNLFLRRAKPFSYFMKRIKNA